MTSILGYLINKLISYRKSGSLPADQICIESVLEINCNHGHKGVVTFESVRRQFFSHDKMHNGGFSEQ
jgi:hypothetical protein